MGDLDRSCVFHLSQAERRIPGPAGENAVMILQRGTLDVALSVPRVPKRQTPHVQDEIYFTVRGHGVLVHDGKQDLFGPGDLLFVAAGIEHQFEEITEDLAVWRVFYGPPDGEIPA